jgi:NADH dehydrogenase [ubiquinone] 1 alpha subcomplex assembly factor 7
MFGEMIGAALADCWTRAGAAGDAIYVELGPGRGTLAADALRVMRRAGFGGEIHLVETSPVLRDAQKRTMTDAHWHDSIEDVPRGPMLLVANEFLDALPIRQFVDGVERHVTLAAGGLAFDRDGEIVETSPARAQAVAAVAKLVVLHGGAALFIDYGHEKSGPGDTLQAVRGHRFAAVLDRPGKQDLTAHVDFEAVARAATGAGASVTKVMPQGEWLKRLGIAARAGALSNTNPECAEDIRSALERLTAAGQMGELFKVVGVHSPDWPTPAGFE